jgi:hypothetical protein
MICAKYREKNTGRQIVKAKNINASMSVMWGQEGAVAPTPIFVLPKNSSLLDTKLKRGEEELE